MKQRQEMLIKFDKLKGEVAFNEIIRQIMDAKIYVKDLGIKIHYENHIPENAYDLKSEIPEEQLLIPSSICIVYDNMVLPVQESNVSNVGITLEPLELKVGFREIENFKQINETISGILEKLDESVIEQQEITYEKFEDNQTQQEVEEEQVIVVENVGGEEVKRMRRRRLKQLILMNISINLRSFVVLLMDDRDEQEYPIVSLNIHDVMAKISQESGVDDPVTFILKKMAIYKYPVLKVEARLFLGANYFNQDNGAYEPLIEPWDVSATVKQKDVSSSKVINVKSDKMLNVNLTYSMSKALSEVIESLNQNKDDWIDDVQVEESKRNHSCSVYKTDGNFEDAILAQKTKMVSSPKKNAKGMMNKVESRVSRRRKENDEDNNINFETDLVEFQNNIDVPMMVELENYNLLIKLFKKEIEKDKKNNRATISNARFDLTTRTCESRAEDHSRSETGSNEEGGNVHSVKISKLKNTMKYFQKKKNRLRNFKIIDEKQIKIDIYIQGMEPIKGVPIEINGRRSYELYLKDESEAEHNQHQYQLAIVVDICQVGLKKIVSLESQVIITNETDFEVQIAHVLLTDYNSH